MEPQETILYDEFTMLSLLLKRSMGHPTTISGSCLVRSKKNQTNCRPGPRAEACETAVSSPLAERRGRQCRPVRSRCLPPGRVGRSPEARPRWLAAQAALIEAADLSRFVGDRIAPDRLALWISLRLAARFSESGLCPPPSARQAASFKDNRRRTHSTHAVWKLEVCLTADRVCGRLS
jgi:hypothetical protein